MARVTNMTTKETASRKNPRKAHVSALEPPANMPLGAGIVTTMRMKVCQPATIRCLYRSVRRKYGTLTSSLLSPVPDAGSLGGARDSQG